MSAHPDWDTHLCAYWSKREKDIILAGPNGPDRHLLHYVLNCEHPRPHVLGEPWFDAAFTKELEKRGYDLTTLKFSIKRTRKPGGDT